MPKRQQIKLKDLKTGESLLFRTLQEACDYITEVTGIKTIPSNIYRAIRRCGTIAKKRFAAGLEFSSEMKSPMPDPNTNMRSVENGWEFTQYAFSKTVIAAEKKIKWYDEDKIEEINKALKGYRCKVFWDMAGDYPGATRKKTRVEIYKKFQNNISFLDKKTVMVEILKDVGLF